MNGLLVNWLNGLLVDWFTGLLACPAKRGGDGVIGEGGEVMGENACRKLKIRRCSAGLQIEAGEMQ